MAQGGQRYEQCVRGPHVCWELRLLTPVTDQRWSGESRVELLTNICEDFTITEKAPTSAFTFKTGGFKNLC